MSWQVFSVIVVLLLAFLVGGLLAIARFLGKRAVEDSVLHPEASYSDFQREKDIDTTAMVERYAERHNVTIRTACSRVHIGKTAYYDAKKRLECVRADTDGQKPDNGRTKTDTV